MTHPGGPGILAINPLVIKSFFESELIQIVLNASGVFEGRWPEVDAVSANVIGIARTPEVDS
jgi:hypothetical protein